MSMLMCGGRVPSQTSQEEISVAHCSPCFWEHVGCGTH